MLYFIQGIRITGHESALPLGSTASLNCTTDLAVDIIEWLDMNGLIVVSGMDSPLELAGVPVEASNLEYTCRVRSVFGSQRKTIALQTIEGTLIVSSVVTTVTITIILLLGLVMVAIVTIAIVRLDYLISPHIIIVVNMICSFRRNRIGQQIIFSEKVKSKPRSSFVVPLQATPSYGGLEDASDGGKQKFDEQFEMKTFGKFDYRKNDSEIYKGIC